MCTLREQVLQDEGKRRRPRTGRNGVAGFG